MSLVPPPDHLDGIANEAFTLFRAGRFAEAYALLCRAGPLPGRPDMALLLARTAIECGRYDSAEAALASIPAAAGAEIGIALHMALLRQRQGRWRESVDSFTRAAELSADHEHVLQPLLETALHFNDTVEIERAVARVRRNLDASPDNYLLASTLAVALTRLGRVDDAEHYMFAVLDGRPDPVIRCINRIDRLLAEERFGDAVMQLEDSAARLALDVPPTPRAARRKIARIVMHNGHYMVHCADANDIAAACGLPVQLLNLDSTPAAHYAAPDTLVVMPCVINAGIPRAIKQAAPACTTAAWDFDNHHSYLWSVLMLQAVDAFFPAHVTPIDYLRRWDLNSSLGPVIPLALNQWSRGELASLYDRYQGVTRSSALSGRFTFYPAARKRNRLLAGIAAEWPEAEVGLDDLSYAFHQRASDERFLSWRRYKTSVALPVLGDISTRFFDALAAGQVPIVARDVLDFDRVIPPTDQATLPVVRMDEYSVAALRTAHAEAIAAFDRGGEAQAKIRHRYVLDRHMLAHRVSEIRRTLEAAAHG